MTDCGPKATLCLQVGINILLNGATAGPPGAGTSAQQPGIAGGVGELQPELWELGVYPAECSLRPGLGGLWDPVPAHRENMLFFSPDW